MLLVARKFENVLRAAGIDPEDIQEIEFVKTGDHAGDLKVKLRPEIRFVEITVRKVHDA